MRDLPLQGDTGFQPVSSETGRMPVSPCLKPFNPRAEIAVTRRNLPHWQQAQCTYFVTFRLADSLPQTKLRAWREERDMWVACHPKPWDEATQDEYETRFMDRIQKWLDSGYGSCALGRVDVRQIVMGALRYFDGQRYRLGDGVLMPNHVHVLVTPIGEWTLSSILHSWKSYTSNQINRVLNRSGTFWMDENFDHIVRSKEQLRFYQRYIKENPVKAGLQPGKYFLWQGDTGFQPVSSETGKMPVSHSSNQGGTGFLPVRERADAGEDKETGRMPVSPSSNQGGTGFQPVSSATGKMPVSPSKAHE